MITNQLLYQLSYTGIIAINFATWRQSPLGFCETGAPYIAAGVALQEKICKKHTNLRGGCHVCDGQVVLARSPKSDLIYFSPCPLLSSG